MPDTTSPTTQAKQDRELFNRIADQYARKDRYAPSAMARSLRLRQTFAAIEPFQTREMDLLEVGCGAGYSSQYLKGKYRTYTGIDYSENLVELARRMHRSEEITFVASDLLAFESPQRFDAVLLIGVLHHVPDIEAALRKCRSLLKSGGYIVANEPQPNNKLVHHARRIRARIDASYSADQEELRPSFLRALLTQVGFIDVTCKPQGLFSTPFAEVSLRPEFIASPLAKLGCTLDAFLERQFERPLTNLTWNAVIAGRTP